MSYSEIAEQGHAPETSVSAAVPAAGLLPVQKLHRIAEVRQQQAMTLRTVSRHMGLEARQLKLEEDETFDLRLSTLYRWAEVLGVPVTDLLADTDDPLSTPVKDRARLVKVMKTVAAIMETAETLPIRRLCQTLTNQLVEIMPELEGVGPWPAVGQRRSLDDYGAAAERRLDGDLWRRLER